mmetsp:Transcript_16230/g.14668  ORF Transcript_16230/g.14668 Transcript_16230/m.14668 type:complete len:195 (+) Transcript_16230:31-615(+)
MIKLIEKYVPKKYVDQFYNFILFRPDDGNHLWQQPPQFKVDNGGVERIKGYRYPAPGSQEEPRIPVRYSSDDSFDISLFKKNATSLNKKSTILLGGQSKVAIDFPRSRYDAPNAGNKKRTYDYDPTGLRTQKSVTYDAYRKAVEKYAPNHLPLPAWANQEKEIIAECERKGLPIALGKRFKYDYVPPSYNTLGW